MRYLVALLTLAIVLVLGGSSVFAPAALGVTNPAGPAKGVSMKTSGSPSDLYRLQQIEAIYHRAGSFKDVDAAVSLFADDAVLHANGRTYNGKAEIRTFFATVAPPFRPENNWIAVTPSQNMRINVQGDQAKMYYECVYIDTTSRQVKADVWATVVAVRSGDKWLIKEKEVGPVKNLKSF